jgi:diguanylate cyclase (GGDEF)-like protein
VSRARADRDAPSVFCLEAGELEGFLLRRRATGSTAAGETGLASNLAEILRKANEFVPSSAGSILLDDPRIKVADRAQNRLTFIAAFGDKADSLLGQGIDAADGIAGHVYRTGRAYFTGDATVDEFFYRGVDELIEHRTLSLVAIPIRIEREVCGVLELINRHGQPQYTAQERDLLEIFAGYLAVSIQNVLDARQAQEIAKRDNLTGLFNDRHLHTALLHAIVRARSDRRDLALIFLDLDYFKKVNDTWGHLAGSHVLREVGELIAEMLPEGVFAARYGGDEFVLVAPDRDLEEAVKFAEQIRLEVIGHTFSTTPGIQPDPIHLRGLTCSIGVATIGRHVPDSSTDEHTKSTLLRLADLAMYVAKETGRNRTATAGEPVPRHDGPLPITPAR